MNPKFQILAPLILGIFCAAELNSCQKQSTSAITTASVPSAANEIDVLINDYEKLGNQYLRVSNKIRGGDVSVTLRYMDLAKELREWPVKHHESYTKMGPQQAQRVASISARTAPYLNQ